MDILNVVVVFLVLEAAICGICHFVCRDRQEPGAETQPKINEWRTHGNPDAAPVSRISRTLQTDEIQEAITKAGGSKTKAAKALQLQPTYLSRLCKQMGIS
jgi:transcriptional regulator with GAF, ATPase, and Fis domain